jgi:hypothetical protein
MTCCLPACLLLLHPLLRFASATASFQGQHYGGSQALQGGVWQAVGNPTPLLLVNDGLKCNKSYDNVATTNVWSQAAGIVISRTAGPMALMLWLDWVT